jgi:prephenate dehydratase
MKKMSRVVPIENSIEGSVGVPWTSGPPVPPENQGEITIPISLNLYKP